MYLPGNISRDVDAFNVFMLQTVISSYLATLHVLCVLLKLVIDSNDNFSHNLKRLFFCIGGLDSVLPYFPQICHTQNCC